MDDRRSSMREPSPRSRPTAGVLLRPSAERADEIEAVAAALADAGGGRVGLSGVLSDLNRSASVVQVPAKAARWGFGWNDEDAHTRRWWPQGITTSGDRDESEVYDEQQIVITSWYSKDIAGLHKGSRITVVDLTEEGPRYRHVLLVDAVAREDGSVDVRPLKIHAGGIVWHGEHLHVAGTARGISTFRLDDIMRVGSLGDTSQLGLSRGSFGYRYLLPVRFTYDGLTDAGHDRMRYSFVSLDRGGAGPRLIAGEYARAGRSTRLVDFAIDPSTSLLHLSDDGCAHPLSLSTDGLEGMQGATVVDGRWYVTTSAGRYRRGSLYVGRPGAFDVLARALPVGVEDITYWPSRDELWSLSEHPGRRSVFSMDRSRLG